MAQAFGCGADPGGFLVMGAVQSNRGMRQNKSNSRHTSVLFFTSSSSLTSPNTFTPKTELNFGSAKRLTMSELRYDGQVVVVTGAGGGLGKGKLAGIL